MADKCFWVCRLFLEIRSFDEVFLGGWERDGAGVFLLGPCDEVVLAYVSGNSVFAGVGSLYVCGFCESLILVFGLFCCRDWMP